MKGLNTSAGREAYSHLRSLPRTTTPEASQSRRFGTLRRTEGSALFEFAVILPPLLVLLVGIIEFSGAFVLRQKMANAAREGARLAVSSTLSDSSCASVTPCSIEAVASTVADYMTNAGVDSSCITPNSPSNSGTLTWTYTCSNGINIIIDRGFVYTPTSGLPVEGTKITLTYPYTWAFNDVLKLFDPGGSINLPTTLTESAIMQNLVSN